MKYAWQRNSGQQNVLSLNTWINRGETQHVHV
jgi:hypothetical protein